MHGYDVIVVADEGRAALDRDALQPDLIIADVRVLEKLLGPTVIAAGRRIPLVLLVGRTPGDVDPFGEVAGLDVSLASRSLDIGDLAHVLATRLAEARAERSLARPDLTEREIEALSWSARGLKSRQIAEMLGLTSRTVEFHVERARKKLGAKTRISAVARAVAAGLIEP
jgi:DNA-binding CsgD family transcriptional regulator